MGNERSSCLWCDDGHVSLRRPCDDGHVSQRASWAILGVILAAVAASCSSSSSSPSTGDAGAIADAARADDATNGDAAVAQGDSAPGDAASGGDAGCGLDFYAPDYAPACQLLLDKYCCDPERACSGDATCVAFVACANACPPPRQDACIAACGAAGSKLDALSACTKSPPYTAPPGIDCTWPR